MPTVVAPGGATHQGSGRYKNRRHRGRRPGAVGGGAREGSGTRRRAVSARSPGESQSPNQLLLFDLDEQPLAMHPPPPDGDPELASQEEVLLRRVLEDGAPQISNAYRSPQDEVVLSFLSPVEDQATGERLGALVGRTQLDTNLVIKRALTSLQGPRARGEGFVLDSEGRVVAHSDSDKLLAVWPVDEDRPRIATVLRGWAYESRNPEDNTRQLVYYLPVEGYPWAVVIRLPHELVLEQATQIATPLLLLQVLLGGGLVVVIPLVTRWLTRPETHRIRRSSSRA